MIRRVQGAGWTAIALSAVLALVSCGTSEPVSTPSFFLELGHPDCPGLGLSIADRFLIVQEDIVSITRMEIEQHPGYDHGVVLAINAERAKQLDPRRGDEFDPSVPSFGGHDGFGVAVDGVLHCGLMTTSYSAAGTRGWTLMRGHSWDQGLPWPAYERLLLLYDLGDHGHGEVQLDEEGALAVLDRIEGILAPGPNGG